MENPIIYKHQHRVQFSDLDLNGHLNSINLLKIVMDARHSAFFNIHGKTYASLRDLGVGLYTIKLSANFRKEIKLEDQLECISFLKSAVGPVLQFKFQVFISKELAADGSIEQVVIDLQTQKTAQIVSPELLKLLIEPSL